MVKTKESKRKKKIWLKILAPREFRNMQVGETVVKAPENAPEPVKTVYQAMNKDYRMLMKAVDKKKNKG